MVYSLALLPPNVRKQQQSDNGNGLNFNGRDVASLSLGNASQASGGGKRAPPAGSQSQSQHKEEEMLKLYEQRRKDLEKLLDIYEQRLEEARYLAGDNFTIADLSHLPNADRLASDPRSRRLFESRKNVSRWWSDVSGRETWQYVKSLQRPPPSSTDANNVQQHRQQPAEEHSKNHQQQRY
jgi:glutathione S-transferase